MQRKLKKHPERDQSQHYCSFAYFKNKYNVFTLFTGPENVLKIVYTSITQDLFTTAVHEACSVQIQSSGLCVYKLNLRYSDLIYPHYIYINIV